jgi:cytidylate kinase
MAIVTISRGTLSGGRMLAEALGRALGYLCIDRDTLLKRAATRRVSEDDLRAALEEPPGFPGALNHKRYVYLALIQAALTEAVKEGNAIYHGLAGHLLLKGAPELLRLRIIAPLEFRVDVARERLKLSRGEALTYIEAMDRDRQNWTRFLYGVDWRDSEQYDLVINLDRVSVGQACQIVVTAIGQRGAWSAESRQALSDFVLASRIRAALAQDVYTLHLEVDVECRGGKVLIRGDSLEEDFKAMERVVAGIPGVNGLMIGSSSSNPSLPHNRPDRP